jgi:hypothetical protein
VPSISFTLQRKSATTSSWGYEEGPSKGPQPALLVIADLCIAFFVTVPLLDDSSFFNYHSTESLPARNQSMACLMSGCSTKYLLISNRYFDIKKPPLNGRSLFNGI